MVPAHHVVEIELVGCPDPEAAATRFFTPSAPPLPEDLESVGRSYVAALAAEIAAHLETLPRDEPIGVAFSGGIDSGAVFLLTYDLVLRMGVHPGCLKAFTLSLGDAGADLVQAREFLSRLGLEMFLEPIEADPASLDPYEAVRVIEDYKPLDVESATMTLALARGIRTRYPGWRHLLDGDGGDENLKDYPIEENPELTIRSVLHNSMLYQEGWGVGKMKHSAVYSGGQSRSYSRTWAPLRRFGFEGFSPYTRPRVIEAAEAIPFVALTAYDHERLYSLKGEIVSRGIAALTGRVLPVFPKRRFQDGGLPSGSPRPFRADEAAYRSHFLSLYA
jgi:asparagine synthase (glutamine-hydrolysing)